MKGDAGFPFFFSTEQVTMTFWSFGMVLQR
jgi:hypothetical protein